MALWDYRSATAANKNEAAATTGDLQFAAALTAGDLLLASARIAGTSQNPTMTDSVNGSWTRIRHDEFNGDTLVTFAFYGTASGTPTVTLNNASSATRRWTIQSYDAAGNTIALDKTAGASGNSTTPSSGNTSTTSSASELLYGTAMVSNASTFTQGSGFTKRQEVVQKIATEDRTVSSTGTYAADWDIGGTADTWGAQILTFMTTVVGDLGAFIGEPQAGRGVIN